MKVDETAPAVARAELEIAAPAQVVWSLLADVERWPEWNPDVRSAAIEGALAPGTRFRWRAGPGSITSVLARVDEPRLIAWTGRTLGIRAVHVYRLEEREGRTLVRSEESWAGPLVWLLRRPLTQMLRKALASGLAHLKREAERRQGPAAAGTGS